MIEQRAGGDQNEQRGRQKPMLESRRFGATQGAGEGGGFTLRDGVELRSPPIRPEQQPDGIQDEINQWHPQPNEMPRRREAAELAPDLDGPPPHVGGGLTVTSS